MSATGGASQGGRRPMVAAAPVVAVVVVMAMAVLAVAVLAGCGGASSGAAEQPPPPNAAATVVLRNIAFNPSTVTIKVGQTVAWKFDDGTIAHNVTFAGFTSPDQTSGYYTHTFTTAGTFPYRCTIHSGMDGTVVVTP